VSDGGAAAASSFCGKKTQQQERIGQENGQLVVHPAHVAEEKITEE